MAVETPLKHQVALLGEEEIRVPQLYLACEGNRRHPEAERIAEASRDGLLRCAVCGAAVQRRFGSANRWHFAVFPGEVPCDHEDETVTHREAKLALFGALKIALPPGWRVLLEERLENGRRPDVLAVRKEGGVRVAFEVQYAPLSEGAWRERHEDYRALGVRDVWLLGRSREGKTRNDLAEALAAAEGQRVVYVGSPPPRKDEAPALGSRPGDPEGAGQARELVFGDGTVFVGETRLLRPGSPAPDFYGRKTLSHGSWLARARRVGYALEEIRLLDDGTLRTPADAFFEEAAERYKRRRRTALGLPPTPERYVPGPGQPGLGEPPGGSEEAGWKTSTERAAAVERLGGALVALLEREGPRDRALRAEPGRWKTRFFLEYVEGRVGETLDFHHTAWGVIRLHRREGEVNPGWGALADFRDRLAVEGFVRFERDDEGMARCWRIARDSAQESSG